MKIPSYLLGSRPLVVSLHSEDRFPVLPYSLGLPRWEENAPHQESFTTSDGRHLARLRVAFSVLSAQDGLFQESFPRPALLV